MSRSLKADIDWTRTICKQPGNYLGWPSIARNTDGEILVVFSGERQAHACPYGQIQVVRSRDGGEVWSDAETICNTALDDRDPGILLLRSGTMLLTWFNLDFAMFTEKDLEQTRKAEGGAVVDGWIRHYGKIPREDVERDLGRWTRRSTDGGRTWETPVASIAGTPHGPAQLSDGRLVMVGSIFGSDERGRSQTGAFAVESADEGRTWSRTGSIPRPADAEGIRLWFHEPSVTETSAGNLVCLARYEDANRIDGFLRQSESLDGGRTWSVPHPTTMWGFPAYLQTVAGGNLLATYGHRRAPFGRRACLSTNAGLTWDVGDEFVLYDEAQNTDLGYPATLELEPDRFLTVDYQQEQPGERTVIVATRWSISRR
jgi:hypothetical protein